MQTDVQSVSLTIVKQVAQRLWPKGHVATEVSTFVQSVTVSIQSCSTLDPHDYIAETRHRWDMLLVTHYMPLQTCAQKRNI